MKKKRAKKKRVSITYLLTVKKLVEYITDEEELTQIETSDNEYIVENILDHAYCPKRRCLVFKSKFEIYFLL